MSRRSTQGFADSSLLGYGMPPARPFLAFSTCQFVDITESRKGSVESQGSGGKRHIFLYRKFQTVETRGSFHILPAKEWDVVAVKEIADGHRVDFGFIPKAVFFEAVDKEWLLVAKIDDVVVGFVRFRHRCDRTTTVYEIAVAKHIRRQGIGRALIYSLIEHARRHNQLEITLKCPVDLPANHFYHALDFQLVRVDKGKRRDLNVWRLEL